MSGENPSWPAVSGDRKNKENLSKIEVVDQKPMFSIVFLCFSSGDLDVRSGMRFSRVLSEIFDTLRGVLLIFAFSN